MIEDSNPTTNSTAEWSKAPLHIFTERKKTDLKKLSKPVRNYYAKQNEWIETLEQLDQMYRDEAHHFVVHDGREQKTARNRQVAEANAKADLAQSGDQAAVSDDPEAACEASSQQQSAINAEKNEEEVSGVTKRLVEKDESAVEVALLPADKPGDGKPQNYALTLSDYEKKVKAEQRLVALIAKGTLLLNILLLIMKIVASALSGSLSVVSSVVDSAVDLASGVVMWLTTRAVRRRNVYAYPNGRTRLEPLGILILSVIMGLACIQVIIESVESIVTMAQTGLPRCRTSWIEVAILIGVIVTKTGMWIGCFIINRRFSRSSETLTALAQDHRNDVLTNSVAIVGAYVGALGSWMRFFDPAVAAAISTYVLVSWLRTGYRHIRRLSGLTASPQLLRTVTWICLNHDSRIREVDTVRGFHLGTNLMMEVDIVLDEQMSLREAHDIGESLQKKIERLPDVERCFVHLDYESMHDPRSEHKQV